MLILFTPFVFAQGDYPGEMKGLYYIWGDPVDKNDRPGIEGFTIFLEGESAERLFKKIESEATYNECWNDGTLTKYQGNVERSLSPDKKYSCAFGVSLKDQKIYRAETC